MHRLLDTLPVFAGDDRVEHWFTLVPGSDFSLSALSAVECAGARTLPWSRATSRSFDLILAAGPKGDLHALHGPRVLLPHGAGFNKSIAGDGTEDSASGLDPAHLLLPDGAPLADRYLYAHPAQTARLADTSPAAAARAAVVGDPLLERLLDSRDRRARYRAALRTGTRTLVTLLSTWGEESLLARRPALPTDLAAALPYDEYQLALVLHPNERARRSEFDLRQQLAPAIQAGLLLPDTYEEWASVVIASDVLVTDHGSAALYAAALDRPLLGAYDGGTELLPDSPMAQLLDTVPRFTGPADFSVATSQPGGTRTLSETVFAEQGRALDLLRTQVYDLLGLEVPDVAVVPRLLPDPAPLPLSALPAAFSVCVRHGKDGTVHVTRHPAHLEPPSPAHHLAAQVGEASARHRQAAALLYRRPGGGATVPVADWTRDVLAENPGGRRTAAVVLSPTHALVRPRNGPLLSARVSPANGTADQLPAILSAVHATLAAETPTRLACAVGSQRFDVHLSPASPQEAAAPA
ncbi:translation initiation factor 2 [Streptomyces sp. SID13726]|nr:translation initiation factor 2 [Streptomyces sp. SID13726]